MLAAFRGDIDIVKYLTEKCHAAINSANKVWYGGLALCVCIVAVINTDICMYVCMYVCVCV